jgi:16S rRNA processing protein RimM
MTLSANELFNFGTVVGLHGLRGDLKVLPHEPGSDLLNHAQTIILRDQKGLTEDYTPMKISEHKANTLLRLARVESVAQAEALVGFTVLMSLDDLPELSAGKHYWHEIQGLAVVDQKRGNIGLLQGMFTTPAHEIYEVNGRFGEVLIPVVSRFIVEIDLDGKRILVDLPEGLIPEPDEG